MGNYRVTAPYVTLKVKDVSGVGVLMGYYCGAVVSDPLDAKQVDAQVALGFLEEVGGSATPEAPADEPAEPEALAKPHGNAGRDAWVTYALESGQASEDEVKDLSRDDLRDLYGN